jgi:beta-lactam-binding protein with PASTA domain
VAIVNQTSATVASGQVMSQDPQAGTVVKKGSTVKLVVSSGPAPPPSSTTTSTT